MMRRSLMALAAIALANGPAQALEFAFVKASEPVLANPHDIDLSADGRLLFVADLGHDRIAVLDALSLDLVGTIGDGDALSQPHDAALGPDGRLYVADTGNSRIVVYRLDGAKGVVDEEITGGISRPEGVLAHPNGRVYATGVGGGNIVAYADGKVVHEAGGLRAPHDIAASGPDHLWVADSGNDRMLLMSLALETVKVLEGSPYDFRGPRYQDVTDGGLLIVADKYTHSIKVIDRIGRLVTVLGTGKPGKGPGVFTTPEGVAVRGADLWLSDSGNDRIVRYRINY